MERMMELIRRKRQIMYELNGIEKYMTGGDYDKSLKLAYDQSQEELLEVENALKYLSNPKTQGLEEKRLSLLESIHHHEHEIELLKMQLNHIQHELSTIV